MQWDLSSCVCNCLLFTITFLFKIVASSLSLSTTANLLSVTPSGLSMSSLSPCAGCPPPKPPELPCFLIPPEGYYPEDIVFDVSACVQPSDCAGVIASLQTTTASTYPSVSSVLNDSSFEPSPTSRTEITTLYSVVMTTTALLITTATTTVAQSPSSSSSSLSSLASDYSSFNTTMTTEINSVLFHQSSAGTSVLASSSIYTDSLPSQLATSSTGPNSSVHVVPTEENQSQSPSPSVTIVSSDFESVTSSKETDSVTKTGRTASENITAIVGIDSIVTSDQTATGNIATSTNSDIATSTASKLTTISSSEMTSVGPSSMEVTNAQMPATSTATSALSPSSTAVAPSGGELSMYSTQPTATVSMHASGFISSSSNTAAILASSTGSILAMATASLSNSIDPTSAISMVTSSAISLPNKTFVTPSDVGTGAPPLGTQASTDAQDGMQPWKIIVIIGSVLLSVALALFILFKCYKKKKMHGAITPEEQSGGGEPVNFLQNKAVKGIKYNSTDETTGKMYGSTDLPSGSPPLKSNNNGWQKHALGSQDTFTPVEETEPEKQNEINKSISDLKSFATSNIIVNKSYLQDETEPTVMTPDVADEKTRTKRKKSKKLKAAPVPVVHVDPDKRRKLPPLPSSNG